MRGVARFALALVALGVVGCGDDGEGGEKAETEAVTGSFVGTVDGSDAYVAVVVSPEGDMLAYVTDGAQSVDWLDGGLQGGRDTAARLGNEGGATLEVRFTDAGASGTFTRPGYEPLSFTADAADAPAGLYRAEETFADGRYLGGWIVLPDDTERGAVRRYETPLPPGSVDPTTFSAGDPTFAVPGGTLRPRLVEPTNSPTDDP